MNWMPESRSSDYYDDEDIGYGIQAIPGRQIPFFIITSIISLIILTVIELLTPLAILYVEFCSIAARVSESGKVDEPGLFLTGICLTLALLLLITNYQFSLTKHPFVTIGSSGFVLLFTLAPLAGLARYFIRHR